MRILLHMALAVLLSSEHCAAQSGGWAQSTVTDPTTLLDLHNALRLRAGATALDWDDSLASSAQVLAAECCVSSFKAPLFACTSAT
jgi:uncharacterized protein YkwD